MMNPAKLLKLKSAMDVFKKNHPKFLPFLSAAKQNSMKEGTIIEINVTSPDGKTISSNIKLQESDIQMFYELSDLLKNS